MSIALQHVCLDCGKTVSNARRGLDNHFDGANPLKITDCCDAMTARAASHTIKELTDQKKLSAEAREMLTKARQTRRMVRSAAARAGRTLNESGSPFYVE